MLVRAGCALALLLLAGCTQMMHGTGDFVTLQSGDYLDRVHGAWQAAMAANYAGLAYEGRYLDEPGPGETIDLSFPDEWSTDDDTTIEWVDLHILETYGMEPTYAEIRDQWLDHLNNDIWCATLRARQLMDEGILPPDTGSPELNPEGTWTLDAQLATEVFGLLAPGMPDEAIRRAGYFARITNSGPAVEASEFYAAMYADAFFESDAAALIAKTMMRFPPQSPVREISGQVLDWYRQFPGDWRATRRLIRDAYDSGPGWTESRVNFASTMMALVYGEGDVLRTLTIACLGGWDADNNATTSVGLLGAIHGYRELPTEIRTATDVYFNEDVTGLPQYDTVPQIAARTQALAEDAIRQAGGQVKGDAYLIPGP